MLLLEHESKALLEKYGIKTATCIFCETEEEAVRAARKLSFPVVMKVAGRGIVHKSDVGGVILNIRSEEEVRKAFRTLCPFQRLRVSTCSPSLRGGLRL